MPSLNWIGKDEVLRYNTPYHTLDKNILLMLKISTCSKSPSFDFIVYFFV